MIRPEKNSRFDELSAGRAMGDLSAEEERELEMLAGELERAPDPCFELLASTLESAFIKEAAVPVPAGLLARLEKQADHFASTMREETIAIVPERRGWKRVISSPITGWAAAAAVALIAWFSMKSETPPTPEVAESRLRAEATDLIQRSFQGAGAFASAGGEVIWSDVRQQGYMILSGIPTNDPKTAQYQLWIVDPTRDEAPVDGGVFDIPASGAPVVVPIVAKLAIRRPVAFVITLEQPGGVVKSKQEKVVALAKS